MALWGKTDTANDKPKYLNAADKAATVGVSVAEAQDAINIAKGINTPGWVKTQTYTDAQGNVRNKNEVLVAFSSLTGDADALPPVPTITIGTQPTNVSALEGETATFTVAATATGGATLSYQWQKSDDAGENWSSILGATAATYTTATLTVADDNNDQFRVVVSGTLGATPVTSTAATLTVTLA